MAGAEPTAIAVEVAYASRQYQRLVRVSVPDGARVTEAITASGILLEFPEIDLAVNRVGIFGQLARLDELVRDGDRVEIYRSLHADPKEARRKRALKPRRAGGK